MNLKYVYTYPKMWIRPLLSFIACTVLLSSCFSEVAPTPECFDKVDSIRTLLSEEVQLCCQVTDDCSSVYREGSEFSILSSDCVEGICVWECPNCKCMSNDDCTDPERPMCRTCDDPKECEFQRRLTTDRRGQVDGGRGCRICVPGTNIR